MGAIVSLFLVGISVVLIPPTSEKADEMAQDINSFDGEISFDGETVRYKGALNESKVPHGKGEIVTKDGRTFTGNFVNGAYSNGLFKYANGDSYTGTFYNNRFSKGTYTIKATGEYFVGTFSPNSGQPLKGKWYMQKENVSKYYSTFSGDELFIAHVFSSFRHNVRMFYPITSINIAPLD